MDEKVRLLQLDVDELEPRVRHARGLQGLEAVLGTARSRTNWSDVSEEARIFLGREFAESFNFHVPSPRGQVLVIVEVDDAGSVVHTAYARL
jgi:hypothetical protein